jgi:hypothetical protein
MRALRACLEKDPRRRLRDLGDWDLTVEPAAAVPSPSGRLQWIPWAVALACCVGTGAWLLLSKDRQDPAPAPPTRFDIPAGVTLSESGQFSISPDGRHLVFAGIGDDRMIRLWIRSFDAPEVRPLIGTEAEVAQVIPPMFWSPDSQFIAFYADGKIMKVSRLGGTVPEVVCQVPRTAVGGSWNTGGDIIAGNVNGALTRCSAAGGPSSTITAVNETDRGRVDHLLPSFLHDGRHFIYFQAWRGDPSRSGIYLGDLDLPPDKQPQERLLATGFGGVFVGGDGDAGHVLFVRDATLMAAPFDGRRLARACRRSRTFHQTGALARWDAGDRRAREPTQSLRPGFVDTRSGSQQRNAFHIRCAIGVGPRLEPGRCRGLVRRGDGRRHRSPEAVDRNRCRVSRSEREEPAGG